MARRIRGGPSELRRRPQACESRAAPSQPQRIPSVTSEETVLRAQGHQGHPSRHTAATPGMGAELPSPQVTLRLHLRARVAQPGTILEHD